MQKKTLTGTIRKEFKKNASARLRNAGKIPAVIYGHQEPISVAIDAHEFNTKFKVISENVIITLTIGGNTYDVLVKDYQENLLKDRIDHLDFYEIEKGKMLKTHVPIHIEGTARGAKLGGLFEWLLHEVEIECLPKDLPEMVYINVDDLDVGKSVHVSDLALGENVKILNNEHQVICHVVRKRDTEEAEAEETEGEEATEEE